MISREMQLEMWKIDNQGIQKSLDELALRYSAPGDEWRRHLPAMSLIAERGSQTDASELRPVSEMDDDCRRLRQELEKMRSENEDALRRQKLFYEAQLNIVGPELRAQAQKQVRALELEMEERLRAVRASCRVQLRNQVARAKAQLQREMGAADLAEAEVQVDFLGDDADQSASHLSSASGVAGVGGSAVAPLAAQSSLAEESRESWTQEREELLHEAAWRLQRQTSTLRKMAARIDELEDQLAIARIKEQGTRLDARRRGGAVLSSAETELRLDAVRRHARRLETMLEAQRKEAEEATAEMAELRTQLALAQGCAALRGNLLGAGESLSSRRDRLSGAGERVSCRGERLPGAGESISVSERLSRQQVNHGEGVVDQWTVGQDEWGSPLMADDKTDDVSDSPIPGREAFVFYREMARQSVQQIQQFRGKEPVTQRLTNWSMLATKEKPPTPNPDRPLREFRDERRFDSRRKPPFKSAESTDSLERVSTTAGENQAAVTWESHREADEDQQAWLGAMDSRTPSPSKGAAEESFYLKNARNQEVSTHERNRDHVPLTLETNASVPTAQPTHSARETGSARRGQDSAGIDDDDDVITEKSAGDSGRGETVANPPAGYSEIKSQSWHSPHGKKEAENVAAGDSVMGRVRHVDTTRGPRSQVTHHVVDIDPDLERYFPWEYPRKWREVGGLEGRELGYPQKYSLPSQQISSFSNSSGISNKNLPPSYTERNQNRVDTTQKDTASWGIAEVKRAVFEREKESDSRDTVSSRVSSVRRTVVSKQQMRSGAGPVATSKASSDTSSVESAGPPPTSGNYHETTAERRAGVGGGAQTLSGRHPEGEPGWLPGERAGGRRRAWRRHPARRAGTLSEQDASDREEADDRRRHRQIKHLETLTTTE